jgi:hypothetical protein
MASKSRFNSTKHGIFATLLCNSNFLEEAETDFKAILSGLRNALRPMNEFEGIQVDKLAFLYLRLRKLYEADWRVAPKLFAKVTEVLDENRGVVEVAAVEEGQEVAFLRRDPSPELLIRYESNIERQIARTLDQLGKYRGQPVD